MKTRVITHNGKCYCLCWKLWQVLKQAGLRVPITSLNQDPQNEDIAKLSLDNDSEEVILAEIHLSLNNAHMVIEEVSDSSELEVQVESDPQMPPVDDKLNVSEELGETIQTVESELGLRNEDVTEHESYGKEVDNDKDTPECKLTDDMKVTNFDKTKIDTLQETCNTKWVTFDGKTEDVKSSTTDDFGVVLTANINKSVSITESKNFEGVAEDKENIKHLDNPPETAEIVRAVDEEMLDTHYDYKSQPESFDADKIEENSVKHSNCLDEGIHYYSAQNSSLPVDINDVDSSAHALVTDPFIDINSVQEIDCEQSEFECDTNAIPEQNMDRDRLNESKQDASPHCLSKDNVTFYHIENCTENTALDSVESLTLGELVSDENDKANVYGQIVDGNSVSHSLHILCDKNGTTLSNSTLPSTRTDQSTSAITDESNHPSSNGSIIASTSSNADESNLLRTIEMTNENNFSSMNAMAEGNGIGSSSTINNENNIQNTNTVHLLDKNLLSAITDESNLPRKSATTEECSVPNASAIADESNLGSASAITAKCYLSTSESVSAITDESHLPNASAVTEENNLSANTNIMKNFPNDTAIIDGNSSYASAIIEQRSSVSVTNQAAENGFRYVGSQIYIARTKEESESKIEEEIVFKPQLKQETGAVSEHIEDEYLYKFYGCFTPYGAKCRPKVYGFRGPLHAWNETEGQFDLVFNDKVTVIDSRARHIPFTEGDKHMVYIPKTYCKH